MDQIIRNIIEQIGYGHAESVYHKCIIHELRKIGKKVNSEVNIEIIYEGQTVGYLRADIIVDDSIILEIKTLTKITLKEINQLQRYLKFFNISNGMIINITNFNFEIMPVSSTSTQDSLLFFQQQQQQQEQILLQQQQQQQQQQRLIEMS